MATAKRPGRIQTKPVTPQAKSKLVSPERQVPKAVETPPEPEIEVQDAVTPPKPSKAAEPPSGPRRTGIITGAPEKEPDGVIVNGHEPAVIPAQDMGATLIVTKDVYRKVFVRNTKRPMYTLLYRAGQSLPRTAYEKLTGKKS